MKGLVWIRDELAVLWNEKSNSKHYATANRLSSMLRELDKMIGLLPDQMEQLVNRGRILTPVNPDRRRRKIKEQEIQETAKKIFKFVYPSVEWGHTGTCDDRSWRDFEQRCLNLARRICQSSKEPEKDKEEPENREGKEPAIAIDCRNQCWNYKLCMPFINPVSCDEFESIEKPPLIKYEHETYQIGASYDTDYKLITKCHPYCPACAAQVQHTADVLFYEARSKV